MPSAPPVTRTTLPSREGYLANLACGLPCVVPLSFFAWFELVVVVELAMISLSICRGLEMIEGRCIVISGGSEAM